MVTQDGASAAKVMRVFVLCSKRVAIVPEDNEERAIPRQEERPFSRYGVSPSCFVFDTYEPVSRAHVHIHLREGDFHAVLPELEVDALANLGAG